MPRPDRLTDGQKRATDGILELAKRGQAGDTYILNGYAGTGKTTLLGMIADELGGVTIIAPTGKAALRVQEATGKHATTIHQWLYHPQEDPQTGKVTFSLKEARNIKSMASKMVIIDEASMVSRELWQDIYRYALLLGLRIVCIGDEFQLPPVTDDPFPFSVFTMTDVWGRTNLTEVTRQALESPIIRASIDLRLGHADDALMNHDIPISDDVVRDAVNTYIVGGVNLVHKNKTRHWLNQEIRDQLDRPRGILVKDEPLLVLKNNYALYIFNGEVVAFNDWVNLCRYKDKAYDRFNNSTLEVQYGTAYINGAFASQEEEPKVILGVEEIFGKAEGFPMTALAFQGRMNFGDDDNARYLHCNLGYVLTAHKSQGSEWNDALVIIEDSVRMHTHEGRRWIYTAMTRAKKNVQIGYK